MAMEGLTVATAAVLECPQPACNIPRKGLRRGCRKASEPMSTRRLAPLAIWLRMACGKPSC
jgi:hypothetical protein